MRLILKAQVVNSSLEHSLASLSQPLVEAAQRVYDEWDASDPEFGDAEVGFGGICHLIVDAWMRIVYDDLSDVTCSPFCHSDEQHVSLVVWRVNENDEPLVDEKGLVELVSVDISPYNYERGGGYSWTKIPGVVFEESWLSLQTQHVEPENLEDLC